MNIFILDEDLDKCAEYHVDKHIIKMPLEAAQMLCTNMWIDKYFGYVPEKVNKEQLAILREKKKNEPRDFPYLPTMHNHPCTIWARSSLDNHEWLHCYAIALNDEYFVQRKLYPNVDFYSGIIYRAMGIPTNMFTVMFALGRLPGWIAQWKELSEDKSQKISRPRQIFTGKTKRNLK